MDIFINHGWIFPIFPAWLPLFGAPYPWSTKVVTWGHHRPCVVHPWSNESPEKWRFRASMTNVDNVHPGKWTAGRLKNRGLEDEKILFKEVIFGVNHEKFPGCIHLKFQGCKPLKSRTARTIVCLGLVISFCKCFDRPYSFWLNAGLKACIAIILPWICIICIMKNRKASIVMIFINWLHIKIHVIKKEHPPFPVLVGSCSQGSLGGNCAQPCPASSHWRPAYKVMSSPFGQLKPMLLENKTKDPIEHKILGVELLHQDFSNHEDGWRYMMLKSWAKQGCWKLKLYHQSFAKETKWKLQPKLTCRHRGLFHLNIPPDLKTISACAFQD